MDSTKYIGMDVHKETVSIAVMNSAGKLVVESILETKAATILQFIQGLRGNLQVTFEEGTWAAWLYDLLKPHVTKIVVCDPRRNALLKEGNQGDQVDARKLAELLRAGLLRPVYHGGNGLRTLKELSRSYLTISKDLTRVMNRLKALYRGWGISCEGATVYAPRHRSEWLGKITEAGVRRRAEFFYQQLDALQALRQQVRRDLLAESRKHSERKLLRQIPSIGPIRAALLMALIQTPHRFRTKRQLWAYSGLAIETHDSAQYRYVAGQLQRSKKPQQLRGLNRNHNHDLKAIFKGAATKASGGAGPFHDFYEALLTKGMRPSMARLTLARKIAAITLVVWKKGAHFDAEQLKPQAACASRAESPFHPWGKSHPWRWPVGFLLRRSGRERVSSRKLGDLCASAPSLQDYPMPSRMTQESYRPRVSDRTMVGNSATTFAYEFQRTEWRRHHSEHETTGMGKKDGGLVAPRPTGPLRDESKRSSS